MSDFETERFHRWLSALHQSPKDLLGDPKDYTFLMLIDRQDHPDAAVLFGDISEAFEALDNHPLVDDLANEDSLDVRLADHGNLPSELAGREIIHA